MKIRTKFLNYSSKRNFTDLRIEGYSYSVDKDLFKVLLYPFVKYLNLNLPFLLKFSHVTFCDKRKYLFHFLNTIYWGRGKWFVTFEDTLPRFNINNRFIVRYSLKLLAKRNCIGLIAMSKNAFNRQSFFLNEYPEFSKSILSKTIILHPPQTITFEIKNKIYKTEKPRFIFVGNDFFRKGGFEIVKVAERLIQDGYSFQLTIIASLEKSYWLDNYLTADNIEFVKKIIFNNPDYITYYPSLKNDKVLFLFENSDVGLLPSYGETYGYSVLEAQAFGCPVVTTNTWAMEEINNDEKGWVLKVPRVFDGGGYISDLNSEEKFAVFSQILQDNLYIILKDIIQNPAIISLKGNVAYNEIVTNHCPLNAALKIKYLYDSVKIA